MGSLLVSTLCVSGKLYKLLSLKEISNVYRAAILEAKTIFWILFLLTNLKFQTNENEGNICAEWQLQIIGEMVKVLFNINK